MKRASGYGSLFSFAENRCQGYEPLTKFGARQMHTNLLERK